jgi:hypothetical protein
LKNKIDMIVENILNEEKYNGVLADFSGSALVCKIQLTIKETEAILHSLGRTMCKGEQLTTSMELEGKLASALNHYRTSEYWCSV